MLTFLKETPFTYGSVATGADGSILHVFVEVAAVADADALRAVARLLV